ncbi:apical junction component [Pimephales promelas]|nr:apical junction component [Pimephales promelas]
MPDEMVYLCHVMWDALGAIRHRTMVPRDSNVACWSCSVHERSGSGLRRLEIEEHRLTDSTDAAQRQGHKLGCSLAGNMMELPGAAGRNHPTWSPNETGEHSKSKKRHCRSFDTESMDKLRYHTIAMEYPHRRAERYAANPDVTWNALDIFSYRLTSQPMTAEIAVTEQKRRTRSRSASRVQTSLTPVSFDASPPVARRGREAQRAHKHTQPRPEVSPRRESSYAATRAHLNEVHPIKLQPQRSDTSRYSPVYVSEGTDEGRPDKPATSPHVRCRVDIKPDESAMQQGGRKAATSHVDIPWQKYPSSGSRSLTVPRHFSTSRTPTPTESFTGEYRQAYQYSQSMPNSYMQPMEIPLQKVASPREPREHYGRERRAHSSPNVPTKFFYAEDLGKYGSSAPSRTYYQDDRYSIPSQPYSPKVQYVQDPRTHIVHTVPSRTYFSQIDHYHYPGQSAYSKHYAASEPGAYIIQTPPARTYYGDDPRTYQIQTTPPRIFYVADPYAQPMEHHIPARAYYTRGKTTCPCGYPPQKLDKSQSTQLGMTPMHGASKNRNRPRDHIQDLGITFLIPT